VISQHSFLENIQKAIFCDSTTWFLRKHSERPIVSLYNLCELQPVST